MMQSPERAGWVPFALLAALVVVAYAHTAHVPLLMDDSVTIAQNASLHRLWPLGPVLSPPPDVFSSGRPLLNFSFALNYAAGGERVAGFHWTNLAIHLCAVLVLVKLLTRVMALPGFATRRGGGNEWVAFAVAAWWGLHPVNTEAVTYISQRAESLMGLCYVTTFYCFLRGSTGHRAWFACGVLVCALGMATKEVMVTAPFLLLLFDRTFIAGSWKVLWRERRGWYGALALTWLVLAGLMVSAHVTARVMGTEAVFSPFTYALTEGGAILRYIQVAFWPANLVFDYGAGVAPVIDAWLLGKAVAVALGCIAAVVLWWRGHPLGWCALAVFILLAPTSGFVPITAQPIAESRLYLPLIPIVAAAVFGLRAVLGRQGAVVGAIAVVGLMVLTFQRNAVYRSEIGIWSDTVAKVPASFRAHNNLGMAYTEARGHSAEAQREFEAALRLKPDFADAHHNLASLLAKMPGHTAEAIAHFEASLQSGSDLSRAENDYGIMLAGLGGHDAEAIEHLDRALRRTPDFAEAHNSLGQIFMRTPGRSADAEAHLRRATALKPHFAQAENNLAVVLGASSGREAEALEYFQAAAQDLPQSAEIHLNTALLLARMPGRTDDAIGEYHAALRLNPDYAEAHNKLGVLLSQMPERQPEALAEFEAAVRLKPDDAAARRNLTIMTARIRAEGK